MAFSLTLARCMMQLCDQAYDGPRVLSVGWLALRGAALNDRTRIDIHRQGRKFDTEAYIAGNTAGDIVVAFRGSELQVSGDGEWRDWVNTDFATRQIPYPRLPGKKSRTYVHRGFWRAYLPVADDVKSGIARFLKAKHSKPQRILVTGHSLGGALAQLAAADIGAWFPKVKLQVYTFASPRVGDQDFCNLLKSRVSEMYHVINRWDPVPYTPPVGPVALRHPDKHYVTADGIRYIRHFGKVVDRVPWGGKTIFNPFAHTRNAYIKAIAKAIRKAG